MEILLTGNTCFVTPAWVEMAFPEDHVLITCARGQPHPPRIRTITLDSKERIGQLVDSYEFDRIVYFSEYLTPHSEQEGELDRLRRVLQANRERPSQLLYLAGPEAVLTPFIGKSVLAQAAEALCRHYAETSRVQIKVLHLPYLYGTDCTGAPVGIAQLLTRPKSGELHFEEQALAPVAALCMEDLSELVLRVFDNWTPEWESLTAPVVFHWNYEQLGEAWKALCPGLTVTYGSDLIREYPPDDGQLRRAYGWFPRYDLLDDLPRFFRQEKQPRRKKWPERLSGFAARHRLLVPVLELLGAWGVSELLVRMTSTQAQFRVVDFRLAFIVLIADVYGLNAGVAAAFLASLSLAAGYWAEGASPLLLFYEPSNWLAFLVYFVVGAVCGYVQLRSAEDLRFAEEEQKLLEERLRFVRQLYQDTLEDKRSFRRQILGRRDSFGKVYAVTKALDAAPAQELPRKIVEIDEVKRLWNDTIVVTCGGGGVPVVENADGTLSGVAAVIDKDYAAELLAEQVDADALMLLTEVEKVAINWGKPNQENLSHLSLTDAARYVEEGHFAPGSMLPKVQACMKFVRSNPEKKAIITSLDKAIEALNGETGTVLTFA